MANIKISELTELTQKANNDYVPIVDTSADETKKISVKDLIPSNVTLLAVSSVEPEECYTGDKYFDTTDNLIYTAIERNVWSTTGEQAQMGINYIVFDTQTAYAYNGTTLVSVGGGAGGGETLPVGTEVDFDGAVSDIPTGWEEVNNVLYENATGTTTGDVNLSDTLTNYNCIEVYGYGSNDQATVFTKIPSSKFNKRGQLTLMNMDGNLYVKFCSFSISNSKLTILKNALWYRGATGDGVYNANANEVAIIKVIGYK